jgi:hypothetical protein
MRIPDMDQRSSVRNDICWAALTRHISAEDCSRLALEFVLCRVTPPVQKVWQMQDRRGKNEKKSSRKMKFGPATKPGPFQIQLNGKSSKILLTNTFVKGEKSNEIGPWTESISQKSPFCDMSMVFKASNNLK